MVGVVRVVFEFVSTVASKLHFSAPPGLAANCAQLERAKPGAEGSLAHPGAAGCCARLGEFQA
ncbi:hypothetical protein A2U01_0098335 [Trifolium medium]|nr:hypothetical protein [Trifolium medium]